MYCFLLLYSIFIFGIVDVTLSGFERLEVPVLFPCIYPLIMFLVVRMNKIENDTRKLNIRRDVKAVVNKRPRPFIRSTKRTTFKPETSSQPNRWIIGVMMRKNHWKRPWNRNMKKVAARRKRLVLNSYVTCTSLRDMKAQIKSTDANAANGYIPSAEEWTGFTTSD